MLQALRRRQWTVRPACDPHLVRSLRYASRAVNRSNTPVCQTTRSFPESAEPFACWGPGCDTDRMRRGIIVGVLVVLLAGCSGGEETPTAPSTIPLSSPAIPTTRTPVSTVDPASDVSTPSEWPNEVALAIRLMHEEFDYPTADIRVVRVGTSAGPRPAWDALSRTTSRPLSLFRDTASSSDTKLHHHGADGADPRRCDFLDF